jgi:hypothetical protein
MYVDKEERLSRLLLAAESGGAKSRFFLPALKRFRQVGLRDTI